MKSVKLLYITLVATFIFTIEASAQISNGQADTFQDGTVQGWTEGGPSPNMPSNIADGGPAGTGDNYLQNISTGGGGAGSRLVMFNTAQWAGDYTTAGVTDISMYMNNLGTTDLDIRLAIDGSGGRFTSSSAFSLTAGSGWQTVVFPISPADLTSIDGGSNVNATLGNVTTLRILHSPSPSWRGSPVIATLGVDNITASDMVVPVELTSFTAVQINNGIRLNWTTATEINNYGFDIERIDNGYWKSIGFIEGNGNSTEPLEYSFIDNFSLEGNVKYRLKQIDFNGSFEYSKVVEVNVDKLLSEFTLEQNYPNPFNPSTTISYKIKEKGLVQLTVYDVLGNKLTTLVNEQKSPGVYEIEFNSTSFGNSLNSGVYFYRLTSGNINATKKLILLK